MYQSKNNKKKNNAVCTFRFRHKVVTSEVTRGNVRGGTSRGGLSYTLQCRDVVNNAELSARSVVTVPREPATDSIAADGSSSGSVTARIQL